MPDVRAKASDSTAVVERINKTLLKHNFKSFKLVSHDDSSYRLVRKIKELMFKVGYDTYKLKQLIILTHNINFHKSLAKSPVKGGCNSNPMKAFYILEKQLGAETTSVRRLSV